MGLFLFWVLASASISPGGEADSAVSMGLSARAQSLADASVGLYGDALSVFYNPAAPAMLTRTEIDLSYQRPYNDISECDRQAMALSVPLIFEVGVPGMSSSLGTISLSLARSYNGGIPEADDLGLTGRQFSDTVWLTEISYANHIHRLASIGISLKTLSHKIDDRAGSGFGMDLGLDWTPKDLTLGFVLKNAISPLIHLGSEADQANPRFALGLAYNPWQFARIILEGELDSTLSYDGAGGLEILPLTNYNNLLAIRAGYRLSTKSITAGLGFNFDGPFLDLGYSQHEDLGSGESATIGWRIAPPPPKKTLDGTTDGNGGTDGVETIPGKDGSGTVPIPGGGSDSSSGSGGK